MNENLENAEINHGFQYGDFVDDKNINLKTTVGDFPEYYYNNPDGNYSIYVDPFLLTGGETINLVKIHENAKLPVQSSEEAACSDLYSVEDISIAPGETKLIPTGLQVAYIPKGYKIEVYCRSGLGSKGLQVGNGVGQIDSDYRGEIKVIIYNSTKNEFLIKSGDRIAQISLEKVNPVRYKFVDSVSETKRGDGGFGSTGS